jgi:lipopolysaccharide export system protein LptC
MITPRWVQLVLVIVIAISGYYLLTDRESVTKQVSPNAELPAFSGYSVTDTNYSLDGVRNYRITASYLDHYSESGDTVFESIVLQIFREGDIEEWHIVSDHAVLDEDHHLTLNGNVKANNLLPDAAFEQLTTETLVIELNSKDFHSDTQVTLEGPSFFNVGQSAKGNFGTNLATLINNVKGVYETTP